jgi:hypothetical protein
MSQARGGLAGIEHFGSGAGCGFGGLNVACGKRGDAGEAADHVQQGALGDEDVAEATGDGDRLVSNPATVTITINKRPPNWVWSQGANIAKQSGVYGTRGAANSANMPGARGDFVSWAESDGTFWIFGGQGFAEGKVAGLLNDLWKRNATTGLWTWVSGSNGINAKANYGAQGSNAPTNQPGARTGGVSWLDQNGKLWMFGGSGFDATSAKPGALNDLWSFDPFLLEWTWWKGASVVNMNGTYGVKGASSSTSTPGARQGATAWVDGENTLWLFGGLVVVWWLVGGCLEAVREPILSKQLTTNLHEAHQSFDHE